ncbi:ABC transporter ATP-binding protein [Clostridium intestinale]|uniref:ABC-type multidrug/protein/lipid transport system, ATPase component n=2 Tax=Clostridium intestinale TaxID=36845 RepID=U2NHK4_9CLOT|nr:ABC transporter ATP-binding protein [Clostridium intestinale]ERK28356.1 ABC-type multidrug/protein/lipid transport system, ATPase component [Clostridium intestinale URNW]QLY79793.1 ABC transporter ATP-binding protein [Clostridium intestinale]
MIKLFRFLKKYWISVVVILVLIYFQVMAELNLPNLMSDIVDTGIVNSDVDYILQTGGKMLLVALGGTLCSVVAALFASKVAMAFSRDVRREVFTHVEGFSLNEFNKIPTSSLITRTTNDITQVQTVMVMGLRILVMAPIMFVGALIMALSKDTYLARVIAAAIPLVLGMMIFVAVKGMPLFKSMQTKVDKLNLVVREGLTGIRVIRAFNRTDFEKDRFKAANKDLTDTAIKVNKLLATLMPLMMFVFNLLTIGILWFGANRIDLGEMAVGDLMAFIQYAMQIMMSVIMVAMMFILIPRASASAVRINEVLDLKPEILDPKNPNNKKVERGHVEFKNVYFRYPGAEEPVLSNISFDAKPGETTAIIGSTGSGKSALINLIPRFYDVEKGSVLVDGVDIKDMLQEDLRNKVGIVPQKAVLFSGSVSDNIRYGKEDATDEEVKHAAEVAQALDFVTNMKDGFDSFIAQGGNNVSGGQKQRLAIARALIRRPEIYVFDDSFSALDLKTDAKLRAALKKETGDSTVIIVAQRVSTVMDADRIIVLEQGEIAGMGTHKELLNNCEIYREIVSSQLSEEEIS